VNIAGESMGRVSIKLPVAGATGVLLRDDWKAQSSPPAKNKADAPRAGFFKADFFPLEFFIVEDCFLEPDFFF